MTRYFLFFCTLSLLLSLEPMASSAAADSPTDSTGFELASDGKVLVVRAQTADEAYGHLVGVLEDMEFYRANGYDVALPDHPAFATDAKPIGRGEVFAREVYEAADFVLAVEILAANSEILLEALEWFAATTGTEGFRAFDRYEVTLTLYGPGGSYDPETGAIVLLTTPDGRFKGGGGAHAIVHEMMHLAVEEGLVRRFDLSHWEKERLVDTLVQRELSESLPDYSLQSRGEKALDPYLASAPLTQVATALERYRSDSR